MRACYVLLVAATSLLAASDAAISAASVQSTLSKVVSPEAAQPIQAEQAAANTQRFLRRHRIVDDDEEDVDSVYEERGKPPPSPRRGWTKRWTTSASWASFASNGMTTATV
ncbi:hypothetical protein PF011_g24862 [Phytophthora fragariae]|uniref:RxLR effector protein n=1 Tax=Phytophthora fragariae TaxID=53985 RepID=A0A6A3I245_9STRA|nr:hypothetical protein PF011_g24862 [Phytophthora fragariae]